MKTITSLLAAAVVVFGAASAMADQQSTGDAADDALNWAAVGGRHAMTGGAYAQVGTKPITHRWHSGAYDSVGSGGGSFVYGPGRAPYAGEGGSTQDFQLQGR